MEREASGVSPHHQRPSPSPHPCSCLRLGPGAKGPVRLGVPGDGLAAEGPSPVLAPGPPAPGPDSAPTSPPCPPDPALGLAHLRDQAGQGPSGPQRPRLQGGEVSALSHEEAVQTRGCPPHGKCLIRGNCSFYRPGSQDVLNLGAKPYDALNRDNNKHGRILSRLNLWDLRSPALPESLPKACRRCEDAHEFSRGGVCARGLAPLFGTPQSARREPASCGFSETSAARSTAIVLPRNTSSASCTPYFEGPLSSLAPSDGGDPGDSWSWLTSEPTPGVVSTSSSMCPEAAFSPTDREQLPRSPWSLLRRADD